MNDHPSASAARNRTVRSVLLWILIANWAVAAAKVIIGVIASSAAVTADGLHSFIDGSSNILGLVAMSFAGKPADDDHPYGHGKFEAIASLGIGAMIGIAMLELGRIAINSLIHDQHPTATWSMAAVMVGTLAVNLAVTTVERRYGEKLKSPLLLADARHTLSDVFVTLAVLGSLVLVKLGYPRADAIVAFIVMGFVARVAYTIIRQAIGALSDTARLDPEKVSQTVRGIPDVIAARDIRSRGMEGSVYVDLKIDVDARMTTERAHTLADEVEQRIFAAFPDVVDVVVHVEPHVSPGAVAQVPVSG